MEMAFWGASVVTAFIAGLALRERTNNQLAELIRAEVARYKPVTRDVIMAWAGSGGFAALHGKGATDVEIADDLVKFLNR